MKGSEFWRLLKRLARRRGLHAEFDERHGKGSHGRIYLGSRFTTMKDRKKEISPGLLKAICEDLGISPEELTRTEENRG